MLNSASLPCFIHLKFCIARSDAGLCRLSGPTTAVSLPEEMVRDGNMHATLPVRTQSVLFVQVRWVYNLPNPETPFFPIAQFLPVPWSVVAEVCGRHHVAFFRVHDSTTCSRC